MSRRSSTAASPSRPRAEFRPCWGQTPSDFLDQLARHWKTAPALVPAARATEELLGWIERERAAGRRPSDPFLHVAARLIYEQTRLLLPPDGAYRRPLADRLEKLNRGRPQAAKWRFPDWLRLADIVLAHRRLPLVALFREDPPSPDELVVEMELPYAARFVEKPPKKGTRTLRPSPLDGLFERAQLLLSAVSTDVAAAQNMLASLKAELRHLPRRPAGRETASTSTRKPA
jgi:hypothetical protein